MASLKYLENDDFRGWGSAGSPHPPVTFSGPGGPAKTGRLREYEDGRVPGRRRRVGVIDGTKGYKNVEDKTN